MDIKNSNSTPKLAWAVMAKSHDGRSELIRVVTDYQDADSAVKSNPTQFYKAGPVPLT